MSTRVASATTSEDDKAKGGERTGRLHLVETVPMADKDHILPNTQVHRAGFGEFGPRLSFDATTRPSTPSPSAEPAHCRGLADHLSTEGERRRNAACVFQTFARTRPLTITNERSEYTRSQTSAMSYINATCASVALRCEVLK
jgi:hypothetical protein